MKIRSQLKGGIYDFDVVYPQVVCNTLGKTNRKCFWGRQ